MTDDTKELDWLELAQDKRLTSLERRLDATEKRLRVTEESFEKLVATLKPLQENLTRGIMGAFSGVFHNLSDSLAAMAQPEPAPGYFEIIPVAANTPGVIIVARAGEQYNFSSSDDPETIINDGTAPLVDIMIAKNFLHDGQKGWFKITQYGVSENGTSAAEAS